MTGGARPLIVPHPGVAGLGAPFPLTPQAGPRESARMDALDADPPTAAPRSGIPEQIEKLARLRDAGILTEAEFAEKKAELLRRL